MSRIASSAYQYLQQSKIPTSKFQRSLPRLKIPKLKKTCQRYLAALEPVFASDPQYSTAIKTIEQFRDGPGVDLHAELLKYDKTVKHSSYINEFWFNMYLSSRLPLPLNFTPFMVWRDAPTKELNDQLVRSTNFIISAIRFKRSLDENVLEPEVFHLNPKKVSKNYTNVMRWTPESIATYVSFLFKAFPLDMSQYNNLFNSTRVPRLGKDELVKFDKARHVLVIKNGQFFSFDVIDDEGSLMSPEVIYANLSTISQMNDPVDKNTMSITEFTTADRDHWAREREHLVSLSESNKQNLETIDSAIFVLCLDDTVYEERQKIEAAHNFLHGSRLSGPTNRWFDKSLSVIVTRDGHAAINFEHSWGDGVAVLRFFNETYNDTNNNPKLTQAPLLIDKGGVFVKRLSFELDDRLKESLRKCRDHHSNATSDLEIGTVEYAHFDRNYFKKFKLSPDSMSQLSFQLAFQRIYNHPPVTYESCSTAAFRGGRTETVRPCTNETNAAVRAILENQLSDKHSRGELRGLLQNASQKHYQLCKEASMGDGFDRHLFALKEIALRNKAQLPALYSDPLFLKSQHYTLSTSTLYGECFAGGGFAPVVNDGFGLGYGYVDSNFGVLAASYKKKRNNTQFVQALEDSLTDIRKIVEA